MATDLSQGDKSGQLALGSEASSDMTIVQQYCDDVAHVYGAG